MSHIPQFIQSASIAVAAGGVLLVLWGLFEDRQFGQRRCCRCGYDMGSTHGVKCPECGHESPSERAMLARRRRWKWAALGLVMCIAPVVVFGLGDWIIRGYWSLLPEWKAVRTVNVGGTILLILEKTNPDERGEAVAVVRDGKRIRLGQGDRVYEPGDAQKKNPTSGSIDLTGDGVPDLGVMVEVGPIQQSLIVFDPTSERVPAATIATIRRGDVVVRDRSGSGQFEVDVVDFTFLNWRGENPAGFPAVALTWKKDRFAPNGTLMRAAAGLAPDEIESQAAFVRRLGKRESGEWTAPPQLWSLMLQLLYTGHAKQAWQVLDLSWPSEAREAKEEFRTAFLEQLRKSLYWSDVAEFADDGQPVRWK